MASLGLTQTVVAVCIWPDLEQGTETAGILLCGEASTRPADSLVVSHVSLELEPAYLILLTMFSILNYKKLFVVVVCTIES